MRITVDLSDEDIRTTIKTLIRQQVQSIVRDEFREVIKAEVKTKLAKSLIPSTYDMQNAFRAVAYEKFNKDEFIEILTIEVNKRIKYINIEDVIADAVDERLNQITKLKKKK